jgi:hypothetical protein
VTIASDGDESGEGPPEVRDQAMLSLSCVRGLLAGSAIMDHGVPRRLIMHDIFDPRWDIYLHVRAQAGKTRCIGLAAVCAVLALALGRQIDEGIFLSGVGGPCLAELSLCRLIALGACSVFLRHEDPRALACLCRRCFSNI